MVTLSKGLANATALSAVLLSGSVTSAHELANIGNTYMREVVPFEVASATLPQMDEAIDRMIITTTHLAKEANAAFQGWRMPALCVNRGGVMHLIWGTNELREAFYTGADIARLHFGTGGTIMPSASLSDEDVQCAVQYFHDFAERSGANTTRPWNMEAAFTRFCKDNFFTTDHVAADWWEFYARTNH